MRIVYVAKHGSGGNNDEDAIAFALVKLGHEVVRIDEASAGNYPFVRGHFMLFHHWKDVAKIKAFSMPRVFWCFDLVEYDDPELHSRNRLRASWLCSVLAVSDLGFCTDGDWVAKDETGRLRWLPQGADERFVGPGKAATKDIPILMTASRNGGAKRKDFIAWMEKTYGDDFKLVERGVHGRELADLIARARIVVAPESPATDRYWSNRVYLTLGFGGFLLHPFCGRLTEYYLPDQLAMYGDRDHFEQLIGQLIGNTKARNMVALAGHARTLDRHLYRHRCEMLVEEVKKIL